jgi:hypothetical protein
MKPTEKLAIATRLAEALEAELEKAESKDSDELRAEIFRLALTASIGSAYVVSLHPARG